MKRAYILSFCFCIWIHSSLQGQEAIKIDPGLEKAVREVLGKPNGSLTDQDMARLNYLSVSYYHGATSLAGLEYAVNLEELQVWSNSLKEVTIPSSLTKLKTLAFHSNQMTRLQIPGELGALSAFELFEPMLQELVVEGALSNLDSLNLHFAKLQDASFLEKAPELKTLSISNYPFEHFKVPPHLSALHTLSVRNTSLMSITLDAVCDTLSSLSIIQSPLQDVSFLECLHHLTSLHLVNNRIVSITIPEEMNRLEQLRLDGNLLDEFRLPEDLPHLTLLGLARNQIRELEIAGDYPQLKTIWLNDNRLDSLIIPQKLPQVQRINVAGNLLQDTSFLQRLPNLEVLEISKGQLDGTVLPEELMDVSIFYHGADLEFGASSTFGFGSGAIKDIAAAPGVSSAAVATASGVYIVRQSDGYVPALVSKGDSWSMALSSTAKWLAVQRLGRLELIDVETGNVRKSWQMQVDERWTALFSGDDRYMVIAGLQGFGFEDARPELISIDLETMEELRHHEMFDIGTFALKHIEISPNGHWSVAITSLRDKTRIVVFDNWEGGIVYEHLTEGDFFDVPWQAKFTSDSSKLVWVFEQIHVVYTKTWREQVIQSNALYPPFAMSNDMASLVTREGAVFDLIKLRFRSPIKNVFSDITPVTLEFSQDNENLLLSGFPGNPTQVYNLETQSVTRMIEVDWDAFNGWNGRNFRPHFIDPQHFLLFSSGIGLEIKSVKGPAGDISYDSSLGEVRKLSMNEETGEVITFSVSNQTPGIRNFQSWRADGIRSGKFIHIENGYDASISANGHYGFIPKRTDSGVNISVYDMHNFSLLRSFGLNRTHTGFDLVGAITNDGSTVAIGRDAGKVEIYNSNGQGTVLSLSQSDPIRVLIFSPDDQFLAARSQAGKVGIWSVVSWERLGEFQTENDYNAPITFSPDSAHLFTKTTNGLTQFEIGSAKRRMFHDSPYFSGKLIMSPDGNWFAGVTYSDVVIWKRDFQGQFHTFKFDAETDHVTSVNFSKDGMTLFAGTGNGRIVSWSLGFLLSNHELSVDRVGLDYIRLSWHQFPPGKILLLESPDLLQWKEVPLDEGAASYLVKLNEVANFYRLSYRMPDSN